MHIEELRCSVAILNYKIRLAERMDRNKLRALAYLVRGAALARIGRTMRFWKRHSSVWRLNGGRLA